MMKPVSVRRCHSVSPSRIGTLMRFGFTERQARFLVHVLVFSGVFLERQYRAFTGLAHGQKTHDFLAKLVSDGYATPVTPGALHRGRFYHVQYKPLYEAIGEANNRHRKPASLGRFVERLMLLDAVLADGRYGWLGTEKDKGTYFREALEKDLPDNWYPHVTFGTGTDKTTRFFPEKMSGDTCFFTSPRTTCRTTFACSCCTMQTCSSASMNGRSESFFRGGYAGPRRSTAMPFATRS